jgi:Beta-propeller repeat/HYDIN/CFA65/VesB-like, Ig-like domain/Abnormal spindle-like microcephaly-assoc'd, ASPM-SPD-2-Hydin
MKFEGNRVAMIVLMMLLGLLGLVAPSASAGVDDGGVQVRQGRVLAVPRVQYARLPMGFERNEGETDGRVKYMARGAGYTLFLTAEGAVLRLGGGKGKGTGEVVGLKLVGANGQAAVKGEGELEGKANYFIGRDPGKWRREVAEYRRVRYEGVYPGIDLVYYGNQEQLEYDFEVGVGRDASEIGLRVEGAGKVEVEGDGELVVKGEGGEVRLRRPEAYQEGGGKREKVEARYAVKGNEVGFEIGAYDRSRRLVIDPVLTYATYLGGTGGDVANGIAVDASGNAYITGTTGSIDFPITSAEQKVSGGGSDVFITKLNPAGTGLLFSTFLGGAGIDSATSIAIDSAGNSYVSGSTYSLDFPTTTGAFQTVYAGEGDGFIAKIGPSGSSLVYSSYIGGTAPDFVQEVAVDSAGNAYLTGSTRSPDFPTSSPLQIGNDGCTTTNNTVSCTSDVFVTKISPSGTSLIYSTYLGGSDADVAQAIAVDALGNAYVAGYTFSTNFPTQNAFQSSLAGSADIFLSALNPDGSSLLFSTYLGGSQQERAFGLALDAAGNIYLTGDTQSKDFPTTSNAFQVANKGGGDAFVCKISPGGAGLTYSTLLGGTAADQGTAIAVDTNGNAYVTGFTQSSDFPLSDPLQKLLGLFGAGSCGTDICSDVFVAELRPSGQLAYSTYLGGSGADSGQAIAVDSSGRAYVVGSTNSLNFPTIAGSLQGGYAGVGTSNNAFVVRVDTSDLPGTALNPQQINFGDQALFNASDSKAVTLINAGSAPLNITGISASGDFAATSNCGTTLPSSGGNCTIQITFTPTTTGVRTDQITVADDAQGSPHEIAVTGTGVSSSLGAVTITPPSLSFPSQFVGGTSASQSVRVTNTGKASLTLSKIAVTGDFAETDTCGSLPTSLNVGDSCTINVAFTPQSSGKLTGTLVITDDAAGGAQTVPLGGTGEPVFSLSASTRSTVIQIGTATTTFTVNASAPSSFVESIALSCSAGATCSFDPPTITAGESSTLTVSGLSATTPNPLNVMVTGTVGGQTASVTLAVFLADFSVTASPTLNTISSGQSAAYTVTITPSNGFSGVVLLSCANPPAGATCNWSPPGLTLNGAVLTSNLLIATTSSTTTAQGSPSGPAYRPLGGMRVGTWLFWLSIVLLAAPWVAWRRRLSEGTLTARLSTGFRLATLAMILLVVVVGTSCNDYSYGPNLTPVVSGTPLGKYTIGIVGTLGNDNSVTRTTSVNLAVGS